MRNDFFNKFLEKSITLRKQFIITAKNEWTPLSVLCELYVQIGHVYTVLSSSKYQENNRKIDNLGDELSDVIFQLIILGNMYHFNYEKYKFSSLLDVTLNDLLIVIGQLSEAVMEDCGHRFEKSRAGFDSTTKFILFKISQCFDIIFNVCQQHHIDIEAEYQTMINDATNWLRKNYLLDL